MKITGNATTIKFEVEKPDEIPMLKRLGSVLQPHCASYANEDKTIQGIEASTQHLIKLVGASQKTNATYGTEPHHPGA